MDLTILTALSPVDGRYRRLTQELAPYFSEFGLMQYRVKVEIEYFIALAGIPLPSLSSFDKSRVEDLRDIYRKFTEGDAAKIKDIEKTTNHDVKAVEYFIKGHFERLGLEQYSEFIHFGLTSQDINNTSIPMLTKEALDFLKVKIVEIREAINQLGNLWKKIPMLARTHGQPASPTTIGKELHVFSERLNKQLLLLEQLPHSAKFGGATGNLNAHVVAYPEVDWNDFADNFVKNHLGLQRSYPTTQIEHYDNMAALFDALKRINTILIDFSRDVWQYISMNYFKQRIIKGEVGSSAMPHKVNPIDFENAEGNLGMANAIFEHLAAKLPVSRLQRDLTDSTVLRNIGVPFAHTLVALVSLRKGISKLELNEPALQHDLEENWAVTAEAIQTILRREGYPKPYEALLQLTRKNEQITESTIREFIETLEVNESVKAELRRITPFNYVGLAGE